MKNNDEDLPYAGSVIGEALGAQRVAELEKQLDKFGGHTDECATLEFGHRGIKKCDCGWNEIKKQEAK